MASGQKAESLGQSSFHQPWLCEVVCDVCDISKTELYDLLYHRAFELPPPADKTGCRGESKGRCLSDSFGFGQITAAPSWFGWILSQRGAPLAESSY